VCEIIHGNIISSIDLFENKNGYNIALTSSWDKTVRVTNTFKNIVVKTFYHDNLVTAASLSSCGN